jgi:hypothetical protein
MPPASEPKVKPKVPANTKGLVSITVKTARTKTLSAIASKNLPRSVTRLYFLAIYPSKKSVKEAIAQTPAQII